MFLKLIIFILFIRGEGQNVPKRLDEIETNFDLSQESEREYSQWSRTITSHNDEGQFSIIAPGLLKSNRNYTLVASMHATDKVCSLRISLDAEEYKASQTVVLGAYESEMVNFHPPKLNSLVATLIVEGIDGCRFRQVKELMVSMDTGPKIYVQTDKAMYKPKDLIQFRVLFLDEHTRPLSIEEPVLVEILDAKQNIVKTFKDIRFTKGVYTSSFLLAERPILGSWSIKVTVTGAYEYSSSKTIQVKKYVLPKFSVHIKTPNHILSSDTSIKAIIYGQYTFGKYVQGVATAKLFNKFKMLQEQIVDLTTTAGVEFLVQNLKVMDNPLNMVVTIRESFTNITQTNTIPIMNHNQRFNIISNDNDFEFKDFVPYRLKVRIQHWNGVAVRDPTTPIILEHGRKSYKAFMDNDGVAMFEFENQHNEKYLITYNDSNLYIPNVYQRTSQEAASVYYCQLKLLTERLHLGSPVKIQVSSSEVIPHLIYTIVGHGNVVRMQHIRLPPNLKSYTISITPSIAMIPISYIYVHYSHNSILRHNDIELVFPNEFENQVSLAAPQEVNPGQEITLELKTKPQSIVGLLAIDLGVYLLYPSYDLDPNEILKELAEDKSYISADLIPNGEYLQSGLVLLTNMGYKLELEYSHEPIKLQFREGPHNYRTQFSEVWIFENVDVNASNTKLSFKLPDSITTWRITAFSLNAKSGLAIVDRPSDIIAIKPFFISLNLPYSVKWGEIVAIPILVFNYHSQPLDTIVTMHNTEYEYEFMISSLERAENSENQGRAMKKSMVPANNGDALTFYIKPTKVGEISLHISAENKLFKDAVLQKLNVESEGIVRKQNQAIYLNLNKTTSPVETSWQVNIQPHVANDISLSVGGDYIVPTLDNLQQLVEMPTGCGEQNMVHFAPNILILQYLKATGEYTTEKKLVATIKSFIDIGYQQQLSYRHANGGYSVFGEDVDEEASTWLTAYAVRFFIKASKFASIETRIINTGLEYLARTQLVDGSFPYTGYLFKPAQKNPLGLTAFVLATFLEDRMYVRMYQHIIEKGLQFMISNLEDNNDLYALSITAFVLQIAGNKNGNFVLQKLISSRKEQEGLIWWSEADNISENNVEITSYILLALLDTKSPADLLPILKWLIKQRNDKGGFISTHDTVVGLQALVKFYQKNNEEKSVNLNITYTAKDENGKVLHRGEFKVEKENYLKTQKQELPKSTSNVSFEISGSGSTLLQLSHLSMVSDARNSTQTLIRKKSNAPDVKNDIEYFIIEPKASILENKEMDLEVCFTYTIATNMVIMDVNLPSGYRTNDEALEALKNNHFVQRVEAKNDYTMIIIYLEKVKPKDKNCLYITAVNTNEIFNHKMVPILMYDYYKKLYSNSKFYNL